MRTPVRCGNLAVLVGVFLLLAGRHVQPAIPAANDAAARARETLGWRIGVVARSFRNRTLFEAIDLTASIGQKYIEGFSEQAVSREIPKHLNSTLSQPEREAVKEKLASAGVTMPTYAVGRMPRDAETCAGVFELGQALGVETIVCDISPETLSTIEQLCDKYRINVAIRRLSADAVKPSSKPEDVLKLCEGRSKKVGVCGELAAWVRAGIQPIAAAQILKERLLTLHIRDLDEDGEDVPWGTGSAGLEDFIKEIYRLELKPTLWAVDFPSQAEDTLPKIVRSIEFFDKTILPIADYHRSYIARTKGVRRLAGVSPEERQRIEQAIPRTAPAVPGKPRRLLVIDLNIGRPGHPSIPHANLAVELMGKETGAYEAVFSNDRSMLQPENLSRFDAVFLNNTIGPLFNTPELANHAVTVTSEDWAEFGEILGARGASHKDADEKVTVRLDDPDSPLNSAFGGKSFDYSDEIFRFMDPYSRAKVHVLLSIDVERTDMNQGLSRGNCVREDNDYAISWTRRYGRGRVFYCSLGHNPYVFWDPRMLQHFLAGIQFALGDLKEEPSASK
jgi:sugar phosphate isomerase/epimerase